MPYNIIKVGRKYELRLIKDNKLLGTHATKKQAENQMKAIEINKTGRLNPELYEKAKEIANEKYGVEHSARKQQQITRIYKSLGGEYTKNKTKAQKSLSKWTSEDWGRDIPEGRYLPKYIREQLTPEEYLKTSIAKMKGTTQYVKQPEEIVEKIREIKEGKGEPFKKVGKYTYYISDKPNKKLMTVVDDKKIYFGDPRYQHYKDKTGLLNPSLNHLDQKRRKNYLMRASNILDKNGEYTFNNPKSPNYHAMKILW
jgi:hypothetical protein